MAKKPDAPCAGGCGKLLWSSSTSLPAGERKCRPCRAEAKAQRAAPSRTHPPRQPRPRRHWRCEVCGRDYRRSYNKQRTCGRSCGVELKRREAPPRAPRLPKTMPAWICTECGTEFQGRRRKYCGATCRQAAGRRRDLVRYGKTPEQVDACGKCGSPKPPGARGGRKYCDPCAVVIGREMIARGRRTRKARKRGAKSEPYTLAEIAERDRYHCKLCRKRVAMTKVVPHPNAPTIDHIVPLVEHGDDVRANVQLAHFLCNSRKGDRGTQQLALVG